MADAGAGRRRRGAAERLAIGLFLAALALLLILDPPTGAGAALWRRVLAASSGGEGAGAERWLFACGLSALLTAVFWLHNAALLGAGAYDALRRYRLPAAHPPPPPELLRECVRDTLLGQLLVRPLLLYAAFPLFIGAGMRTDAASLPGCRSLLLQLAFCAQVARTPAPPHEPLCRRSGSGSPASPRPPVRVPCLLLTPAVLPATPQVDDALFYWSHRAMHESRWLYKHVHRQHHQFVHTVGLAVEYAHPVEDLANAVATMAGPLLLGAHMGVVWLYAALKLTQSIDAHSGFDLPFPLSVWSVVDAMDAAPAHGYHHSHSNGCYGGYFVFWDRLCGTDRAYKRWLLRAKAG